MNDPGGWASNKLGYEFRNPGLLELALTHRSFGSNNNERLEFLGDSILGYVIAEELYARQQHTDEGGLTRLRAYLVRRDTLADIAAGLSLTEALRLGSGEARAGAHQAQSIQADAMEALFGAVLLDGGVEAARTVILRLYAARLADLPSPDRLKDSKTQLQEALQAMGLPVPEYEVVREEGPPHAREFEVACTIADRNIRTGGFGASRRIAEQEAAAMALEELQQ